MKIYVNLHIGMDLQWGQFVVGLRLFQIRE